MKFFAHRAWSKARRYSWSQDQVAAGKLHTVSQGGPPAGARRLRRFVSVGEAWLGRRPDTAKVAGSNPAEPTTAQV